MRAGDTILVHAGLYRYSHLEYGGANHAFPFEGTYYLMADGTPERPIVIKAAGDGEVVFDGNGNFALFNVMAADRAPDLGALEVGGVAPRYGPRR